MVDSAQNDDQQWRRFQPNDRDATANGSGCGIYLMDILFSMISMTINGISSCIQLLINPSHAAIQRIKVVVVRCMTICLAGDQSVHTSNPASTSAAAPTGA